MVARILITTADERTWPKDKNEPVLFLVGFDGYDAEDKRDSEMDKLLSDFQKTHGAPSLLAITSTRYKLESTSIYSML